MFWLLLVLLPLALAALLWMAGYLIATLVWLTPFLKAKLWVARLLVVGPFRLVDTQRAYIIGKEVEWIVRKRHGPVNMRQGYGKLLEKGWAE